MPPPNQIPARDEVPTTLKRNRKRSKNFSDEEDILLESAEYFSVEKLREVHNFGWIFWIAGSDTKQEEKVRVKSGRQTRLWHDFWARMSPLKIENLATLSDLL